MPDKIKLANALNDILNECHANGSSRLHMSHHDENGRCDGIVIVALRVRDEDTTCDELDAVMKAHEDDSGKTSYDGIVKAINPVPPPINPQGSC